MRTFSERYITADDPITVHRRESGTHVITYSHSYADKDTFCSIEALVNLRNEIDRHLRELDESASADSSRLAEAATGYESIRREVQ